MKNDNRHIYFFIFAIAFAKIILCNFIELGNDESYYYTYALKPQLNYFDHPPMVGLLIRLTTLNLHFVNDVTLRLGAILSCAFAGIFIYKISTLLHSRQAGWYAVLIYNFSVYTGVIAGFFILPDSLQMTFWCGGLYTMLLLINKNKEKQILVWMLLGLLIGIATLCKVHSLYLWTGFGLYILFYKTKWLLNYRLYVSFFITVLCCLPIIIWNINNDFITYTFHSKRVANTSIHLDYLLREIVGEALYQNPIIYVLIIIALINLFKKANLQVSHSTVQPFNFSTNSRSLIPNSQFLLLLSIPMILLFWCLSLFNEIFPHWSGPGYIGLYIFAAIFLANTANSFFKRIPVAAGWLLCFVFIVALYCTNFYGGNFGKQSEPNFGENCPTLDISGWHKMSEEFNVFFKKDIRENNIKNPVILINKWFPACQIELYTSRKCGLPVLASGNLEDVHQFEWLNKIRPKLQLNNDAYCIIPSNQYFDINVAYGKYFSKIELAKTIEQMRGGKVVRHFYIYRLLNCIKTPEPILP